jgi:hypothetical protein
MTSSASSVRCGESCHMITNIAASIPTLWMTGITAPLSSP